MTPGPWLRLCGVGATAAAAATVASGSLGIAHRALAAIALPPLVAIVIAAWRAYPRLLPWALASLVSFLVAIGTWWAGAVHVAAAAVALAVIAVSTVQLFRGEHVPAGLVARLRDADEAAHHVAAAPDRRVRDVRRRGRSARPRATSPCCSSASRSRAAARARSTTSSTRTSTS